MTERNPTYRLESPPYAAAEPGGTAPPSASDDPTRGLKAAHREFSNHRLPEMPRSYAAGTGESYERGHLLLERRLIDLTTQELLLDLHQLAPEAHTAYSIQGDPSGKTRHPRKSRRLGFVPRHDFGS